MPTGRWGCNQRLDNKSRMGRETHVRFRESLKVRFLRATRLLLFDDDPGVLSRWRDLIRTRLRDELKLELNRDKTAVYSCREGLTFLGFRMSRGRRRVSSRGMRRVRARLKRFRFQSQAGLISDGEMVDSMRCWTAHSCYADSLTLRRQMACEAAG